MESGARYAFAKRRDDADITVGWIIAADISDYDSWNFRVEGERHEPDPETLNEFIDSQIEENYKRKLANWVK